MLVKYFRQNQPAVLILLLPLVLALWPGSQPVVHPMGQVTQGMPAFRALRGLLIATPWTVPVIGGALVLGLSLLVNHVVNENDLFDRRNHLPALLLPLVLALFPQGLVPGPALAGMPFVIWAMHRLWGTQGNSRVLGPLFDGGLLIGIAASFYLPYLFLVAVFWSSIAVMRPFHWREYLMPVIGAGAILFILWGSLHLLGPGSWQPRASLLPSPLAVKYTPAHWLRGVLISAFAVVLLVIGIIEFAAGYSRGVMREKNTRASFLAFTFSCGLLALFNWSIEGRVPPVLVALPMAVFLSWPMLLTRRSGWAEAAVWAIILLGVWGRWG